MKSRTIIAVAIAASFLWAAAASAEMKEGLWEITTKAEMKGLPSQMPATTTRTCITKKDMVPKPAEQRPGEAKCTMKDQKVAGDTVTYSMECTAKDGTVMELSGKMTYKGDSLDGASTTTVKTKGQGTIQMSSKMTGKYLGPCTK